MSLFNLTLHKTHLIHLSHKRNIARSVQSRVFISTILLLLSFVYCTNVAATTLNRLFEVAVPVMSQSTKERKVASKKAFALLLIRVTGKRNIVESAVGASLMKNANRFIGSFRYEVIEPAIIDSELEIVETIKLVETQDDSDFEQDPDAASVEQNEAPIEEKLPTQNLIVSFDEKAVKNSLWKQQLPVWGKTRPSTLLWIAVQDLDKRMLLDSSEPTSLLAFINEQAEKRGVPILYPLLDLEDQININVTDVWGGFKEPVQAASERYQPEAVLSVRLFLDPFGAWQTRWLLYQGSEEINWQVNDPSLKNTVEEGIDLLAEKLAQRYAHVQSGVDDNGFLIRITDVNNVADYVKVSKYLVSLSSIKYVDLEQIRVNELIYRLELRGTSKALSQSIKLGKVLLSNDNPFNTESEANRLSYRLMP